MSLVLQKGTRVGKRYELQRLLGEGGMGAVWAAQHTVTKKAVALKILKGQRPEERRRFLREARAASAVRHPSIVQIHDILEESGTPVLVMDLLVGRTLGTHLAQRGKLTVSEAAQILAPAISGVGTAHALGIVHRDLKPENIFIADGVEGGFEVKVLDFGVAKLTATEGDAAQTGGLTRTGEMVGTPYYMSPEQVFGESDVDHRADIWSLGVILYECLAGKRPFEGDNVGQILKKVMKAGLTRLEENAPEVPQAVAAMVNRMLSVERADRPQDLREVLELLKLHTDETVLSFGSAQPVRQVIGASSGTDPFEKTAAPDSIDLASPALPVSRRSRTWIFVGAILTGAAIAAGVTLLYASNHKRKPDVAVQQHPAPPVTPPVAVPPVAPPPENVAAQHPSSPPAPAPAAPVANGKSLTPAPPVAKHGTKHHGSSAAPQSGNTAPDPKKLPGGVVNEVPF
jgi:serine/threonine-protein kinase